MSDLTDGLILHLPLTQPLTSGPIDRSSQDHQVKIIGEPQFLGDPHLGAAHRFSGTDSLHISSLTVDGKRLAFTIQLWLLQTGRDNGPRGVFTLGEASAEAVHWSVLPNGDLIYVGFQRGRVQELTLYPAGLTMGKWVHLTIQCDGKNFHTWRNGAKLGNEIARPDVALGNTDLTVGGQEFTVGGPPGLRHLRYLGNLAHLRVYDRVLSSADIQDSYHADLTLRAAFIESHPVRLTLLDENEESIIYISDQATGEPLTLELFNVSGRALFLDHRSGDPGPDNYHFELRFRSGTLHRSTSTRGDHQMRVINDDDWSMSPPIDNGNGTVSFFLLRNVLTGNSHRLASERAERIALGNVRADPSLGARSARVELNYANLHLGGTVDEHPVGQPLQLLHGSSVSQFSVLSHVGRAYLPLHACFIGGNTIIPGAHIRDNRLTIRLTNIEPELPIPWQAGDNPYAPRVSYFEIGFDYELDTEDKPWALCRLNEALTIIDGTRKSTLTPDLSASGVWQVMELIEDGPPSWRIYSSEAQDLGRGEYIEFTLHGIVTTLATGTANLYLRYANIPGYQAGQIVMSVEKSHLVMRGERIGIGTNDPQVPLHIASSDGMRVGSQHNDSDRTIDVQGQAVTIGNITISHDSIELDDGTRRAVLHPQSLSVRDTATRAGITELRADGLAAGNVTIRHSHIELNDRVGSTILHPQSLTVRDDATKSVATHMKSDGLSTASVQIKQGYIELEDSVGKAILHPQSLSVKDKSASETPTQMIAGGLSAGAVMIEREQIRITNAEETVTIGRGEMEVSDGTNSTVVHPQSVTVRGANKKVRGQLP